MQLQINGEPREFPDGLNVAGLVGQLRMKADRVAVELNLEIVPRSNWDSTLLKDGDKLEIVHFVGGGSGTELSERPGREPGAEDAKILPGPAGWNCPTCGEAAERAFCANCGEKKTSKADFSLHHFFTHALGEFFHFDSKIFRTWRFLFLKPGFLTAEYVRGCRKPYLHPFQVFFIANLIYFVLQPYTGWSGLRTTLGVQTHMMSYSRLATALVKQKIAAQDVGYEQFERSFDHRVDVQARSLVVVMAPIYGLLVAALQWRKRQFFGQHLVFSLHFTAFWLIAVFIVLYPLGSRLIRFAVRHGAPVPHVQMDLLLFPAALAVLLSYAALAFRVGYGDSVLASLAKAAVLTAAFHYVLDLYRFILFLAALAFS